jgi:hypothetical protein
LVDPETCRHLAEVQALAADRGFWIDVPVNFAFGHKRAEQVPAPSVLLASRIGWVLSPVETQVPDSPLLYAPRSTP